MNQTETKAEKNFPNGFTAWQETHFEVVSFISLNRDENFKLEEIVANQGTGGLYELAEQLTDEFEKLNENMEWDGEFFDAIELFLNIKFVV